MTDAQKPFTMDGIPVDATGWCHVMEIAPFMTPIDIIDQSDYRFANCERDNSDGEFWWSGPHGTSTIVSVPRAWRLPPAPPVKGGSHE